MVSQQCVREGSMKASNSWVDVTRYHLNVQEGMVVVGLKAIRHSGEEVHGT